MGRWLEKAKSEPVFDGTAALTIPDTHAPEDSPACAHASACGHTTDYLVEEFKRTGKLRVEFEGSAVYLVRTYEIAGTINDGTVYTLSEWTRLARLPIEEIRLTHRLRI